MARWRGSRTLHSMLEDSDEATKQAIAVPRSILIVSATAPLVRRCREIAPRVGVVFCHECTLATLTTMAVERKPLAILFPEHLYAFDAAEFDALARDVQASVFALASEISDHELEAGLQDALLRAELLRQPEPPSSRYAVVPHTHRRPKRR